MLGTAPGVRTGLAGDREVPWVGARNGPAGHRQSRWLADHEVQIQALRCGSAGLICEEGTRALRDRAVV
jgi:hypothetical protein